ncbi:MAG: tetratricopeptide repeat protein [Planctomycetes bacterium]|nr:tetratricopeptide repeat protein [Planctomycetota bacterium]
MLWFAVPLSLAFYIRVFLPEEIVHDRYLYLSLFGAALTAVGAAADVGRLKARTVLVGGAVVSVILLTQTVRYNRVWKNDISLFERAVQVDPDSALAHGQLGNLYRRAGRTEEAIRVLKRALEIHPDMRIGVLNLAIIAADEGRYDDAEREFKRVLDIYPDDAVAIDQLTRVYTEQRRFAEAAALLRSAVERLPYERIKYTRNLAVVAYQSGDKAAAARTLESIRNDLGETDAGSVTALYMLGEVYLELGRRNDALDAFRQFLEVSKAFESPELEGMRDSAQRRIER